MKEQLRIPIGTRGKITYYFVIDYEKKTYDSEPHIIILSKIHSYLRDDVEVIDVGFGGNIHLNFDEMFPLVKILMALDNTLKDKLRELLKDEVEE